MVELLAELKQRKDFGSFRIRDDPEVVRQISKSKERDLLLAWADVEAALRALPPQVGMRVELEERLKTSASWREDFRLVPVPHAVEK